MSSCRKEAKKESSLDKAKRDIKDESVITAYPGLLNEEAKSILDLGIGQGNLVLPLLKEGWAITGYEFNADNVAYLRKCSNVAPGGTLNVKEKDLNSIGEAGKLAYENELKDDLQRVKNVVMINVAPLLESAALCRLLFTLMDNAQPETVFFFCSATMPALKHIEKSRGFGALPLNYVPSFFARTDMVTLHHETQTISHEGQKFYNDVVFIRKVK